MFINKSGSNSKLRKYSKISFLAISFVFVLVFLYEIRNADAVTITLVTPANGSINNTANRNINFTFYANFTDNGDPGEVYNALSNCSLWVTNITSNYTQVTTNWSRVAYNNSQSNISNASNSATPLISWINYTFDRDGNYTWSVSCNQTDNNFGFNSTNFTFTIDLTLPNVTANTPAGTFTQGLHTNFSSSPLTIEVSVLDNNTNTVWYIFNNLSTIITLTDGNQSTNTTIGISNDTELGTHRIYRANISTNFNSSYNGPGAHSLFFCANDSAGNKACTNKLDFILMGVNITQLENIFTEIENPGTATKLGGLNITYGNGTEVPTSTFMNPVAGGNFTFIFNFSASLTAYIVGGRIDEQRMGNASRTNMTSTVTDSVRSTSGTRFNHNFLWVDIASFIPAEVNYEYGIFKFGGTGLGKKLYCNGSTSSSPNCFAVSRCNSTTIGLFNYSLVIPANSACWLEGGEGYGLGGNSSSEVPLAAGYTYLFVDHFSGGDTLNDTTAPNITITTPHVDFLNEPNFTYNTTSLTAINFTVSDLNSSGMNLSKNSTINVTFRNTGDTTVIALFLYNITTSNVSCSSSDSSAIDNASTIACGINTSIASLPDGRLNMTIIVKDTSNNTNANVTSLLILLDSVAPSLFQFNLTNTSNFNGVGDGTTNNVMDVKNGSGWVRQGSSMFAITNISDNLTKTLNVSLQFYNTTSESWMSLNSTIPVDTAAGGYSVPNGQWANISITIPTGHNEFEGTNTSFRIRMNDTIGNSNTSVTIMVQINDTTSPTLVINGTFAINGTNISDTTPKVSWYINDQSKLKSINVSFNGATRAEAGESGCKNAALYDTTTGAFNVNGFKNGSLEIASTAGCPLGNGSHYVVIDIRDTWNNNMTFFHNFSLQSGTVPALKYNVTTTGDAEVPGVNNSNITSRNGIGISATDVTRSVLNLTYISSCNSTSTVYFSNASIIYPFNESSCPTASANRTLTVTITDTAGNSNTTVLGFLVDNVGPVISVNSLTTGLRTNNNVTFSISAKDNDQSISAFGYYLDDHPNFVTLNQSAVDNVLGSAGTNITTIMSRNLTPGLHTVKISVNDSLGNFRNSSAITLINVIGSIDFASMNLNGTLLAYNGLANITKINLTNATGDLVNFTDPVTDQQLNLFIGLNLSEVYVNVTIVFNASAANWDKYNFTVRLNDTKIDHVAHNWSTNIPNSSVWVNGSIVDFLPNNTSYYAITKYPINASQYGIGTKFEIWYFDSITDLTGKTNVTECASGFGATLSSEFSPCWNNTDNMSIKVYMPHFSALVFVNDSTAPTVNVTTPVSNQTISTFNPNITVSLDTIRCIYSINSSADNKTMTVDNGVCLGQTENFKNKNNADNIYNITFTTYDYKNNTNTYFWKFNISDTTAPNNGEISSSPSSTSATITVTAANESVNVTVLYGTSNSSLSSVASETDFNSTQTVSLSGLTASTTYYFNISTCDYNGNCRLNGTTFSFTASAASSSSTSTTDSSTAGSSSTGGGTTTTDNVVSSTTNVWTVVSPSTDTVMPITKSDISLTEVTFKVKSESNNVQLRVESLKDNPLGSAPASKVYQYVQIVKTNLANTDIETANIKFKVPKSWLSSNGIRENNIVLYRYDSAWTQLSTKVVSTDAVNIYYEATTPGFSTFAVGIKSEEQEEEIPTTTTTTTLPSKTDVTPEIPEETPLTPVKKEKGNNGAIIAIVAVVAILSALLLYLKSKKKK